MRSRIEQGVVELFALVSEALAQATWALMNSDVERGQAVVAGDHAIDAQAESVEQMIWALIDSSQPSPAELRQLVAILLILPELERSADLAEHVAQRAVTNIGNEMTPISRGIVQRMSEVAVEMWHSAGQAYANGETATVDLQEDDDELDILHDRLTAEVASGSMLPPVAAQVTLLARFYERIGDHAVNLNRRMGILLR